MIPVERVIQQERQGIQDAHFFLKNTNSADFMTDGDSRWINRIKVMVLIKLTHPAGFQQPLQGAR